MLRERMIPCQSREAVVTVLSYENGVLEGCLQHPRLEKSQKLKSVSQLVLLLDSLLDLEGSMNSPLSLVPRERSQAESKAVFRIQILFREHYTWQGRLIWENENQEIIFHSAIELIQLLDEILGEYKRIKDREGYLWQRRNYAD